MTHFPIGKLLPLHFFRAVMRCHRPKPLSTFDPTHSCTTSAVLSKGFSRTRHCPIYLWFLSVSFHPIPQTPSVLSSVFSFYPFVFATDEKIAVIIGQVHMIPITCQSFHLSPGFQTLPLSQINELCLAFLISPTSFCLPVVLLPHCSWQILSLVLFFFPVIVTAAVSPSIIQEWFYCEGPLLHSVGSVVAVDANER